MGPAQNMKHTRRYIEEAYRALPITDSNAAFVLADFALEALRAERWTEATQDGGAALIESPFKETDDN